MMIFGKSIAFLMCKFYRVKLIFSKMFIKLNKKFYEKKTKEIKCLNIYQ